MTVAPLTATVLADADESDAGIASADQQRRRPCRRADRRLADRRRRREHARRRHVRRQQRVRAAFHEVIVICAGLLAAAGVDRGASGSPIRGGRSRRSTVPAASSSGLRSPPPKAEARPRPFRRSDPRPSYRDASSTVTTAPTGVSSSSDSCRNASCARTCVTPRRTRVGVLVECVAADQARGPRPLQRKGERGGSNDRRRDRPRRSPPAPGPSRTTAQACRTPSGRTRARPRAGRGCARTSSQSRMNSPSAASQRAAAGVERRARRSPPARVRVGVEGRASGSAASPGHQPTATSSASIDVAHDEVVRRAARPARPRRGSPRGRTSPTRR